jgi:hypothetical protein
MGTYSLRLHYRFDSSRRDQVLSNRTTANRLTSRQLIFGAMQHAARSRCDVICSYYVSVSVFFLTEKKRERARQRRSKVLAVRRHVRLLPKARTVARLMPAATSTVRDTVSAAGAHQTCARTQFASCLIADSLCAILRYP